MQCYCLFLECRKSKLITVSTLADKLFAELAENEIYLQRTPFLTLDCREFGETRTDNPETRLRRDHSVEQRVLTAARDRATTGVPSDFTCAHGTRWLKQQYPSSAGTPSKELLDLPPHLLSVGFLGQVSQLWNTLQAVQPKAQSFRSTPVNIGITLEESLKGESNYTRMYIHTYAGCRECRRRRATTTTMPIWLCTGSVSRPSWPPRSPCPSTSCISIWGRPGAMQTRGKHVSMKNRWLLSHQQSHLQVCEGKTGRKYQKQRETCTRNQCQKGQEVLWNQMGHNSLKLKFRQCCRSCWIILQIITWWTKGRGFCSENLTPQGGWACCWF